MSDRRSAAQDAIYFRVLRLLEETPDLTQREIAEKLGLSLGGVNYCLRALVDQGFVKIQNFRNHRNKLAYIYLLTPTGIARKSAMTAQFLKRKLREYEALTAEIAALKAELDSVSGLADKSLTDGKAK